MLRSEGDDTVQRFLAEHENVEAVPIPATWGEATACGRRIAPSAAHDGFYYATLRKTGDDRASKNLAVARSRSSAGNGTAVASRSEEHTSDLQSLMRTPIAVFCFKKKKPH